MGCGSSAPEPIQAPVPVQVSVSASAPVPEQSIATDNSRAATNGQYQIFLSYRKNDCGRLGTGDNTAALLKSKLVELGCFQSIPSGQPFKPTDIAMVVGKVNGIMTKQAFVPINLRADGMGAKEQAANDIQKAAKEAEALALRAQVEALQNAAKEAEALALRAQVKALQNAAKEAEALALRTNVKASPEEEAASHERMMEACNTGDCNTVVMLLNECAAIINTRNE
eukprot:gene30448-35458_t